jgi:hypothetical protein
LGQRGFAPVWKEKGPNGQKSVALSPSLEKPCFNFRIRILERKEVWTETENRFQTHFKILILFQNNFQSFSSFVVHFNPKRKGKEEGLIYIEPCEQTNNFRLNKNMQVCENV